MRNVRSSDSRQFEIRLPPQHSTSGGLTHIGSELLHVRKSSPQLASSDRWCRIRQVHLAIWGNRMHDRSATPKPLVDDLPELKDSSRDLRIDCCRGIALWWIFLDH